MSGSRDLEGGREGADLDYDYHRAVGRKGDGEGVVLLFHSFPLDPSKLTPCFSTPRHPLTTTPDDDPRRQRTHDGHKPTTQQTPPLPAPTPLTMPPPLQSVKYENWKHPILIYHYSHSLLPLSTLSTYLRTHINMHYVRTRTAPDPLVDVPVPSGDEIPPGCYEALYLPNVFHYKGCALGFRVGVGKEGAEGGIEWFCFRKPIEDRLGWLGANDVLRAPSVRIPVPAPVPGEEEEEEGGKLFDLVATLEKVGKSALRDREHFGVHNSEVGTEGAGEFGVRGWGDEEGCSDRVGRRDGGSRLRV
ncbi:hypothetical protein M011DRAFT_471143 [Sporormia fimetaria CBS 119925]|uniref:Uncharacterized protein n=1 Tax=Sporormia fimetaria CBS 119925 TaxID=1340428 RepID=A0A6A6V3Q1_9PLEO|nr:hypothetical protein M011DRAFT_471143 [Sporormia fimetaria CBS 119925]